MANVRVSFIILMAILQFSVINSCCPKSLNRIKRLLDHIKDVANKDDIAKCTYGFDLVPVRSSNTCGSCGNGLLKPHTHISDILCGSCQNGNYEENVGGFICNQETDDQVKLHYGQDSEYYNSHNSYDQPIIHHLL